VFISWVVPITKFRAGHVMSGLEAESSDWIRYWMHLTLPDWLSCTAIY